MEMTNGWIKIQIHKNSFFITAHLLDEVSISSPVCFDDFCYRRLWNDFRHRRIGSHRFGALNLWDLRLVNHRFLDHRGVRGRVDHFFVAVGDPDESLLAESTLLL